MKRIAFFSAWLALCLATSAHDARADVLFESGTLGPTGIPWSDLENGTVPGTNVSQFVYPGVRFNLPHAGIVTELGGHFASASGGSFFAAIVDLDNEADFPDSADLSTADVVGVSILTFPAPSAEVFGDIALSLDAGWYSLVFGSGLFGTNAVGGAPQNNTDIGDPSYISFQAGTGWFNLSDLSDVFEFNDYRFIVRGFLIPEPETLCLASLGVLLLGSSLDRRRG